MGSPTDEVGSNDDEKQHDVELTTAFYMGVTEVTEHQWATVMEEASKTVTEEIRDPKTKRFIKKVEKEIPNPKLGSKLPVRNVSWYDAMRFCERLSELPGERDQKRRYRLPTEAEWEYACRAGSSAAYCFGADDSQLRKYACYSRGVTKLNIIDSVEDVGSRKPNAFGLYDMHGNVWEWVYDCFGAYSEIENSKDPVGPCFKNVRGQRGGAYSSGGDELRSARRAFADPRDRSNKVGFRIITGGSYLPSQEMRNSLDQKFSLIPAGSFIAKFTDSGLNKREVTVRIPKSFYMSQTEVTQKEWRQLMNSTPWRKFDLEVEDQLGFKHEVRAKLWFGGDDCPAAGISWFDAVRFCEALSKKENRKYRLPLNKEWEYAARAGGESMEAIKKQLDDKASISVKKRFSYQSRDGELHKIDPSHPFLQAFPDLSEYGLPVATFPANAWNLFDMDGNVSEWCSDEERRINRESRGRERRFRAGDSFSEQDLFIRGADWLPAESRLRSSGFRLVLEIE
jgi:formylglycine-generating enzyme required for sulfatase activity